MTSGEFLLVALDCWDKAHVAERLVTVAESNSIPIADRRVQAEYAAMLAERLGLTPKQYIPGQP